MSKTMISRRDALALSIGVTLGLGASLQAQSGPEPELDVFVPENDYPFFGYEPDPGTSDPRGDRGDLPR